jgi:hypothetical protein
LNELKTRCHNFAAYDEIAVHETVTVLLLLAGLALAFHLGMAPHRVWCVSLGVFQLVTAATDRDLSVLDHMLTISST